MLLHKLSNTLCKGLLLFVLTSSPTATISTTTNQPNDRYNQQANPAVTKNRDIKVSAEEKSKTNLSKDHFASYTCNENLHEYLLNGINTLRGENHISKATLDGQLNTVACAHTKWMLKNQNFGHRGVDDTGFISRCLEADTSCTDENILKDVEGDFVGIFTKITNDANTREKMLDPDHKNIGFGLQEGVLTVIYR